MLYGPKPEVMPWTGSAIDRISFLCDKLLSVACHEGKLCGTPVSIPIPPS
jgi:hypothetical protein